MTKKQAFKPLNTYEDGFQYAKDVISGKILVGEYVRLAAERFKRMVNDKDANYYFSEVIVNRVCAFFNVQKHVKGSLAGQHIKLEPFQVFILCGIYGFLYKKNDRRLVTDAAIEITRKQSKSFMASGIGLAELGGFTSYDMDKAEGAAEVYCTAFDRNQAKVVFEAAQAMLDCMPNALGHRYKLYRNTIHRNGDRLSIFTTLSRDAKSNALGKGASCHIIDEAAIVTRDAILAVNNGMIHRASPLRLYITTAHYSTDSLYFEYRSWLINMLKGAAQDDPTWFGLFYSIPDGIEWDDPRAWYATNPLLGISIPEETFAKMANEAKSNPTLRNEFLCRNLNAWVNVETAFIQTSIWDKCARDERPKGRPDMVTLGVDLAMARDLNAIATLERFGEEYWLDVKCFMPREAMVHIPAWNRPVFERAIADKIIHLTPGNVSDYSEIYDHIIRINTEKSDIGGITTLGYDPWNASGLLLKLSENTVLETTAVGQGLSHLSAASKEFYKLVHEERIHFKPHPFWNYVVQNCGLYIDPNENWKIIKADSYSKIDPIIASVIALKCCLDRPQSRGPGVWFF